MLSFLGETRMLFLNPESEMEEIEIEGFDCSRPTIVAANVDGDQWLQVTADQVVLISCSTQKRVATWKPVSGEKISVAYASKDRVLLSYGHGYLSLLEAVDGAFTALGSTKLSHDIACVSLLPATPNEEGICAVGLWGEFGVRLLRCPDLEELHRDNFGGNTEVVPRFLQFLRCEDIVFLLVTLGTSFREVIAVL